MKDKLKYLKFCIKDNLYTLKYKRSRKLNQKLFFRIVVCKNCQNVMIVLGNVVYTLYIYKNINIYFLN